ncbi:hypothetical protein BDV32DRAFT_119505 [Aspergillus pseudonomiae]|nr:hypothetical protein BDV32DRAFT_119505 [Aspergillus pseudonomiae]
MGAREKKDVEEKGKKRKGLHLIANKGFLLCFWVSGLIMEPQSAFPVSRIVSSSASDPPETWKVKKENTRKEKFFFSCQFKEQVM